MRCKENLKQRQQRRQVFHSFVEHLTHTRQGWKFEFKEGRYPPLNVSACDGVATPANKKRGEHENYDACQDYFFSKR
jgi:hypothetical protein